MKTTKKDFALFKKELEKWKPVFGNTGWRISVGHEDYIDKSARAWYEADLENRVGNVNLAEDWDDDKITPNRIKRSAFHELFHVRLSRISKMLIDRGYSFEDVNDATHEIIHTFENYFYGDDE